MRNDFCVLILTHARPNRIPTLGVLQRGGYTGPVYLVVDNEDDAVELYRQTYGDQVIVFDKAEAAEITDTGDNEQSHRGVVFARNAAFGIVRDLGYRYFLVLDDDYTFFAYCFDEQRRFTYRPVRNLDHVFTAVVEYLESTSIATVAFAQSGDFLGGAASNMAEKVWVKRKAMNSFFCDVERPWKCYGRINEDVTAYAIGGSRGQLFFQINHVRLNQMETQHNPGGLTDIYLDIGTYVKSFYSVMYCPSFVRVRAMGTVHPRLHHQLRWNNAVPKILRESCRK
jgi:hypothetical protein